jgi:proline iminopeptidase
VIGARHDTMDPKHMEWMAGTVSERQLSLCPEGSHMAFYDDQATYFDGLIKFLRNVDAP